VQSVTFNEEKLTQSKELIASALDASPRD